MFRCDTSRCQAYGHTCIRIPQSDLDLKRVQEESAHSVTDASLICQMKRDAGRQLRDRRRDSRLVTRANDFAVLCARRNDD